MPRVIVVTIALREEDEARAGELAAAVSAALEQEGIDAVIEVRRFRVPSGG